MNIVYFLHDTNSKSGASKAVLNLLEQLKTKGDKVYVVLPNKHDIYIELLQAGIPCFVTHFRNAIYPIKKTVSDIIKYPIILLFSFITNMMAVRKITKFLTGKQIDIIHSNTSVIDVGYKVARKIGCNHIYHIREFVNDYIGVNYFPSNQTFKKRIQFSDKYSYSACIIPELQRLFKIESSDYSRVIYDGVCHQKEKMIYPSKEGYLVFVGRIEEQKGLLPAIEGYVDYLKISKKRKPLKVLGSINQTNYYNKVIQVLKASNALNMVEFCGMQEDVHKYLRHADAAIIASLSEGFGFCMAEAMFDECVVVGNDKCSGTHQQFENGLAFTGKEIGYRYTKRDELTKALIMAEQNDNTEMIRYAWVTVNAMYTQEKNFETLYSYYNYILENERES